MTSELFNAVISGNIKEIESYLSRTHIDWAAEISGEENPIIEAASNGRVDILLAMISNGASPYLNSFDATRTESPLLAAISCDSAETVSILVTNGANANFYSQALDGETPLSLAITLGRVEITEILLNHGANPNIQGQSGKNAFEEVVSFYGERKHDELSFSLLELFNRFYRDDLAVYLPIGFRFDRVAEIVSGFDAKSV